MSWGVSDTTSAAPTIWFSTFLCALLTLTPKNWTLLKNPHLKGGGFKNTCRCIKTGGDTFTFTIGKLKKKTQAPQIITMI